MKVLQINVVYKNGSTGKIVYDIHSSLLKYGIESIVCYGRGSKVNEPGIYKIGPECLMRIQSIRSRITGYIYSGCTISTNKIIKIIEKENPDIVHLHCLNGYIVNIYKILEYLKSRNIKTVLTLHAEFMHTAGCGYANECEQWKTGCCSDGSECPGYNTLRPTSWIFNRCNKEWNMMKAAFSEFDNLTICPVSDWLKDRAIQSPFLKDKKFITVKNGLDTDIFKIRNYNHLREKHSLNNEKIILHVTPDFTSEIKGGKYVIELAKRFINNNVKFIIVGFNGDIYQLPSNVIPVKHTSNQSELAAYYSMADITLLTSKKETFSMVCAESLCCGTPVVGFKAGAPETIAIEAYSEFIEYGDIESLESAIRRWLHSDILYKNNIAEVSKNIYCRENMFNKYMSIYKDVN